MTLEEQKQIDQLRQQLDKAKQNVDEIRTHLSRSIGRLTEELRLYRGLFWCLLAFATVVMILSLLRR